MNMKRKILFLAFALFGLFLFPLRTAAQSSTIRFDRLTVEDGLSQNAVLTIAQDGRGFLWLGTEDGLNKYDGYSFTVYEHDLEDPTSLVDSFVSVTYVDHQGDLWVGTRSGLDRYDPATGSFIHFSNDASDSNNLQGEWVISVFEDSQGTLWVGTEEGSLSALDRATGTFTHYRHDEADPSSISENAVRVIFEDSAGKLWIGTHTGLDRFDRTEGEFIHVGQADDDPTTRNLQDVSAISEDEQGILWIGTEESGVFRFDPASGDLFNYPHDPDDSKSLSHNRVRAIYHDHLGNLWIGTQNGLDFLSPDNASAPGTPTFLHYRHDPLNSSSLGSSAVWSIFEDRSGVMWFGTYGGGLNKYNRSTDRFRLYQHHPNNANSLSNNMIWAITEDSLGRLWVGTFNGGLNMLNRTADKLVVYWHDETDPGSLLSDDVRAIIKDDSGKLWIGTAGGLNRLDPRTNLFTDYTHDPDDPSSLSGNRVNVLLSSSSGSIWVGTRYDGLNRLDPLSDEFTRYQNHPDDPLSLGDDRVWALYEDHLGAIWVGTLNGISVFNPESDQFIRYEHDPQDPRSLSSNSVFSFNEDPDGSMWIGTWGGGLNRFDRSTGSFDHFTESDGLPNDTIYGIEVDSDGLLWMSTNRGLARFDPRSGTFQNYDVSDGLQDNEFNVGAHFTSESGEMFFGGIRGFNAFFPADIQLNPSIPPVVITTFFKFNQPVRHDLIQGEQIELTYQENFVAFEFSALDFNAPESNRYAYMLEGFDEDWIEAGTRRYVSYTNLDSGDYIFRVKGSNSDGTWNDEGTWAHITVAPPYWETLWFRAIALFGLFFGLGFGILRWRVRTSEARSRELEGIVQERTREIEQRRQELDALYRADDELFRHLEVDQVFRALVDIAVEILHADKGSLFFWDDQTEKLILRAAKGFKPETLEQMQSSTEEGTASWVLETGQPAIVHNVRDESHVATWVTEAEGIQSFMHIPIKIENEIFGVFNVDYIEQRAFGKEEQRLFTALAQRAALAIRQAQLQGQAQQAAVFEERQRLARDLHDAVTQTLFSASIIAEVIPRLWEKDPEIGRSRLETLRELTKGALAEMRTLLIELRPMAIAEADLVELMRQLAESTIGRARIPVDLQVEGECDLSPEVKIVIYRIAQEALNNVAKHSKATRAAIRLVCEEQTVKLTIEDDGIGFDFGSVPPDHLGLGIMRERAESIGAELAIESELNEGSRITLTWMW